MEVILTKLTYSMKTSAAVETVRYRCPTVFRPIRSPVWRTAAPAWGVFDKRVNTQEAMASIIDRGTVEP